MNPITEETKLFFSCWWKEKYKALLVDEHWQNFAQHFNAYLFQEDISPSLPYFQGEITPSLNQVMNYFKVGYQREKNWSIVLENAPFEYLLIVLGQRLTPASIKDERAIPPLKEKLLFSCDEHYKQKLCKVTRAWEKHVGRSADNFWGMIKGNTNQKNQFVKKKISEMIDTKTWWNLFFHYKHELVYEIRVSSGHGVRWNKEGTIVIGFLEPFINDEE